MGTSKEEWVSFDSELKVDREAGVQDDPLREVSLDEEKPPPVPPRTKTPEAVAEITVSKQEETAPRRLSVDAGIKSGDVEQRPIRNSKIMATVFPTNAHLAWIIPPKYDPTKLPQTLSASGVGLQVDVFSLVMRHITDDIRFKAYAIGFSRILPIWVVFSIVVLLLMLISSPDGGFSVMVMTFLWTIMLLVGVFFGIIIRKHLKIGLAQVVSEANKHLLHHNLIVGVQDRGQLSCHKVVIIFMYYQTQDCLVDIEKQLRISNSTAKPKPILMTHDEMANACDQLLRDHIQIYIKSFVKRRLLFPTRPSEGVSDFRPKHSPKNHCLCQFIEEEYFNSYKKTWYEKLV